MMALPTPETDAEIHRVTWEGGKVTEHHAVSKDFARKLERERDEAREKAERYRNEANAMMMQRDEARGERDRLAEALRKAISWGDSASYHILDRQNINWTYLNEAKEALQSLNQPTPEQ